MIIVTGGAGFIGSNLVKGLNQMGESNIIVVDNLTNVEKIKNLQSLQIADYIDKEDFIDRVNKGQTFEGLTAILHQGACSDTMAEDGRYVMHNNYDYSKSLYHYCVERKLQFIYASSASVYGDGDTFVESPEYEIALNAYAYSKLLFDNYVRHQSSPGSQVVGLRYFNVYGEREQHKGRMASVAWHFFNQYQEHKKVRLFEGSDGYANGEQLRDFIFANDVVKVNLFLLENKDISGIFNVGTGQGRSFNNVAMVVINSMRSRGEKHPLTIGQAVRDGVIEYIKMPPALQGKYQSYTQADMDQLRKAGYEDDFQSIEQGVQEYVNYLAASHS